MAEGDLSTGTAVPTCGGDKRSKPMANKNGRMKTRPKSTVPFSPSQVLDESALLAAGIDRKYMDYRSWLTTCLRTKLSAQNVCVHVRTECPCSFINVRTRQ